MQHVIDDPIANSSTTPNPNCGGGWRTLKQPYLLLQPFPQAAFVNLPNLRQQPYPKYDSGWEGRAGRDEMEGDLLFPLTPTSQQLPLTGRTFGLPIAS